jgi:hypothetical protein
MMSALSAHFRVTTTLTELGTGNPGSVNLSLYSPAAMRGFVGSVSEYGVQLDIICIGTMLSCVQINFDYILCFLSVFIYLDCKQNIWPILCYWDMENRNTIMTCITYTKLD